MSKRKISVPSLCSLRSELLHLFLVLNFWDLKSFELYFWEISSSYDKYRTVYSASHSWNKHETQDSFRSITSFPRFLLFVDEWFYVIILLFYIIDVLSYVIVLLFSFFCWTKQDTSSDLHVVHVSLCILYVDLDGNCSNRLDNDRNIKTRNKLNYPMTRRFLLRLIKKSGVLYIWIRGDLGFGMDTLFCGLAFLLKVEY